MNETLSLYIYALILILNPKHPDPTSNSLLDHPSKYLNHSITNLPSIIAGNKNAQKEWPQVSVYETVILASIDCGCK
jgi:hypothetical protein